MRGRETDAPCSDVRRPFKILGTLVLLFFAAAAVLVVAFPVDDHAAPATTLPLIESTAGADAIVCAELGVVFGMVFEGFSLEESLALGLNRGWPHGVPRQEVRRVILQFELTIELEKEHAAGQATSAELEAQAETLGDAMHTACPDVAERVLEAGTPGL